ncbi:MAG: signal recognition particle protein [Candidatus Improbicoccus pseudotrichonymphae]|uniref:Signal recognition particle protein n=1 Tax=Candidatus Improbicoccus pseudotrichonymphae TaxID=3033792 RepID=A0AA48HY00_9FIRM|nr:MAG: signal recognition particle protein [Candidatus Improbicoccus pseudotrichonymphae]
MVFSSLTSKLADAFKKITSKGRLSEPDIRETMRQIRLALLESDVNYSIVKDFSEKLTSKIMGIDITKSLTPSQMVIKMVNEELVKLLGGEVSELNIKSKTLSTIMLCGLQGSGKTTQAVKLALHLKKKKYKPLLVACDIYRPAAVKQLEVFAKSVSIEVFFEENTDPVDIARNARSYAFENNFNIMILDTAGRLQIDEKLMKELQSMKIAVNPREILLVIDSMSGQEGMNVASEFDKILGLTGVIVSKFDSDARGGVALSVASHTGKNIKYIGTGENVVDFEVFDPKRIASRILGMGDILTIIENAEEVVDKQEAKKLAEKLAKNKFNFNDFLNMMDQIKKLGPLKSIIERIPGVSNLGNFNFDEKIVFRARSIIQSMTEKERNNPEILDFSRRKRIAAGSGNKLEDVSIFLNRFENSRKMIKKIGEKNNMFANFFKRR